MSTLSLVLVPLILLLLSLPRYRKKPPIDQDAAGIRISSATESVLFPLPVGNNLWVGTTTCGKLQASDGYTGRVGRSRGTGDFDCENAGNSYDNLSIRG